MVMHRWSDHDQVIKSCQQKDTNNNNKHGVKISHLRLEEKNLILLEQ